MEDRILGRFRKKLRFVGLTLFLCLALVTIVGVIGIWVGIQFIDCFDEIIRQAGWGSLFFMAAFGGLIWWGVRGSERAEEAERYCGELLEEKDKVEKQLEKLRVDSMYWFETLMHLRQVDVCKDSVCPLSREVADVHFSASRLKGMYEFQPVDADGNPVGASLLERLHSSEPEEFRHTLLELIADGRSKYPLWLL